MSYLLPPRLVFSGKFQADVSTVNNDPAHFDSANFQPNYTLPGAPDGFTTPGNMGHQDGWWNPKGTGAWRFFNCAVNSVTYRDGTVSSGNSPTPDPIIGAPINAVADRVEGKLVDLDPEQQMVSQIWGFRVMVGALSQGVAVGGSFRTAAFSDIWTRFPTGKPDSFFGAIYQSVLENLKSSNAGNSRFLQELLESNPESLSIKFNVDGMNDDSTTPMFTFGRVVGSIGLQLPDEPKHFVFSRQLLSMPGQTYGTAYAKLDGSNLYLDLGNTIPTASAGGPLIPHATNFAALQILPPTLDNPLGLKSIAEIPDFDYAGTAGIVCLKLSSDDAAASLTAPLTMAVIPPPANQITALVSDASNPQTTGPGQFVRADDYVFRFNPTATEADVQTTDFYATQFGEPFAGQQISLALDSSLMEGFVNQGVPVPGPPVGAPTTVGTSAQPVLSWTANGSTSIATDANGKVTVSIAALNPGNPRGYIDGQVYGITYGLGPTPPPTGSIQNPSQILNPLIYTAFEAPEQPNWMEDIQPIFQQYANLYPIMKPIVDLASYSSVVGKIRALKRVFGAPETDPNYMPVTRDLSKAKRAMILKWLDRPLYMNLDSVEDVQTALQTAVELEHATIPAYLTALYSIKPGQNTEAAELIRSVVMEEMLHMNLVCNILISIGGNPQIGRAGFMPTYPGPLPGGLRGDLIVSLRRCSIEHIRDCFMSIEQPATTDDPVHGVVKPGDPMDRSPFTIGWFYREILHALADLGPAVTYGNVDKQVMELGAFPITCLADAQKAIDEIILQGEGTSPGDPDAGKELSHYYKFSEIVHGRRIVVVPGGFSYSGGRVPFNPDGVYPMMNDPDLALYPTGSRAEVLGMQFAQTYQNLLNSLNTAFNGAPQSFGDAVGLMYSLSLAARQLMQTPSGLNDGTTAGPCFQLPIPGLVS